MLLKEYLDNIFVVECHLFASPDILQVVPLGTGSIISCFGLLSEVSKLHVIGN
jgi:hypothetical protein